MKSENSQTQSTYPNSNNQDHVALSPFVEKLTFLSGLRANVSNRQSLNLNVCHSFYGISLHRMVLLNGSNARNFVANRLDKGNSILYSRKNMQRCSKYCFIGKFEL